MVDAAVLVVGMLFGAVRNVYIEGNNEEALKKNWKAFELEAKSDKKLRKYNQDAEDALTRLAMRKRGILMGPMLAFSSVLNEFRTLKFERGKGMDELEHIEIVIKQIQKKTYGPDYVVGREVSAKGHLVALALLGPSYITEAKLEQNLRLAKANYSESRSYAAQIDLMCTMLNGITTYSNTVSELLEKLGNLYSRSVRHIQDIYKKNGKDPQLYTDNEIDSINLCVQMTKVIYRIINTPILDSNGSISDLFKQQVVNGQNLIDKGEWK